MFSSYSAISLCCALSGLNQKQRCHCTSAAAGTLFLVIATFVRESGTGGVKGGLCGPSGRTPWKRSLTIQMARAAHSNESEADPRIWSSGERKTLRRGLRRGFSSACLLFVAVAWLLLFFPRADSLLPRAWLFRGRRLLLGGSRERGREAAGSRARTPDACWLGGGPCKHLLGYRRPRLIVTAFGRFTCTLLFFYLFSGMRSSLRADISRAIKGRFEWVAFLSRGCFAGTFFGALAVVAVLPGCCFSCVPPSLAATFSVVGFFSARFCPVCA